MMVFISDEHICSYFRKFSVTLVSISCGIPVIVFTDRLFLVLQGFKDDV